MTLGFPTATLTTVPTASLPVAILPLPGRPSARPAALSSYDGPSFPSRIEARQRLRKNSAGTAAAPFHPVHPPATTQRECLWYYSPTITATWTEDMCRGRVRKAYGTDISGNTLQCCWCMGPIKEARLSNKSSTQLYSNVPPVCNDGGEYPKASALYATHVTSQIYCHFTASRLQSLPHSTITHYTHIPVH